jgi:hypothetical protein
LVSTCSQPIHILPAIGANGAVGGNIWLAHAHILPAIGANGAVGGNIWLAHAHILPAIGANGAVGGNIWLTHAHNAASPSLIILSVLLQVGEVFTRLTKSHLHEKPLEFILNHENTGHKNIV